jgi:hypothetical protein
VLVVLGVALALLATGTACHQAGLDRRAHDADIRSGLPRHDSPRGFADVGAVQARANAAYHLLQVALAEICVGAARAGGGAPAARLDAPSDRVEIADGRLGMGLEHLSNRHVRSFVSVGVIACGPAYAPGNLSVDRLHGISPVHGGLFSVRPSTEEVVMRRILFPALGVVVLLTEGSKLTREELLEMEQLPSTSTDTSSSTPTAVDTQDLITEVEASMLADLWALYDTLLAMEQTIQSNIWS